MSKLNFDEFIQKQTKEQEVDWSARLSEWRLELNNFYDSIKLFIKPYLEDESISLSSSSLTLHEGFIGSYEVESMQIQFRNEKVELEPIGTLIVGAKGRVDMKGPCGSVRLILVAKDSVGPRIDVKVSIEGENQSSEEEYQPPTEWSWKIVSKSPKMSYVDLSEDSFFDALLEIMNG